MVPTGMQRVTLVLSLELDGVLARGGATGLTMKKFGKASGWTEAPGFRLRLGVIVP